MIKKYNSPFPNFITREGLLSYKENIDLIMGKEENKYYTPTIDEFHTGFEFESVEITGEYFNRTNSPTNRDEWKKYICTLEWLSDINREFRSNNIDWTLPTSFRVKYLDKEDIESLGFKCTLEQINSHDRHWCEFKKENMEISVQFGKVSNKYPNHLNIRRKSSRFSILIKNKSELKKLLKQLGID